MAFLVHSYFNYTRDRNAVRRLPPSPRGFIGQPGHFPRNGPSAKTKRRSSRIVDILESNMKTKLHVQILILLSRKNPCSSGLNQFGDDKGGDLVVAVNGAGHLSRNICGSNRTAAPASQGRLSPAFPNRLAHQGCTNAIHSFLNPRSRMQILYRCSCEISRILFHPRLWLEGSPRRWLLDKRGDGAFQGRERRRRECCR